MKNDLDFFWNDSAETHTLRQSIQRASRLNVPILIVGETGSGKEIVARELFEARRKHLGLTLSEAPFVPINVSTIPESLAESALFGHERGAFTSARERKQGKFEAAQKGCLFLDEAQALPLSVQSKLMRVFQDLSFERLGGKQSVPLNCQVILASNQPLELLVEKRLFRMDLYYRLNAYPIFLAPLRLKKNSLRQITEKMNHKVCRKFGLTISQIPSEVHAVFDQYDWPGNYRELEFVLLSANLRTEGRKHLQVEDLPGQVTGQHQAYLDNGYWSRNVSY